MSYAHKIPKFTQYVDFFCIEDECDVRAELVRIERGFAYVREYLTWMQPGATKMHKVCLTRLYGNRPHDRRV